MNVRGNAHTLLGVALIVGASACRDPGDTSARALCDPPAASLARFVHIIETGCYLDWAHDRSPRLSGAIGVDGVPYTVHGRMQVYYSHDMAAWARARRASDPGAVAPADGSSMVAELYAEDGDDPVGYVFMYRNAGGSQDGWLWGRYDPADSTATRAEYGFARCLACHASAASYLTFADGTNLEHTPAEARGYRPPPMPGAPLSGVPDLEHDRLSRPRGDEHAGSFVDFYNAQVRARRADSGLPPGRGTLPTPAELPMSAVARLPPRSYDHVPSPAYAPGVQFVTSDQCAGCHAGTELLSNVRPNMVFAAEDGPSGSSGSRVDLSHYAEWNVSLMGLAGRDPVFLAQAETERALKAGVEGEVIDNACYSCHGPMGQRQYVHDREGDEPAAFSHYMVYATAEGSAFRREHEGVTPYDDPFAASRFARFGALARDGVSCAACHHMGPSSGAVLPASARSATGVAGQRYWETFYGPADPDIPTRQDPPGPPFPFTAQFDVGPSTLFGACSVQDPCPQRSEDVDAEGVSTYAHRQALGLGLVEQDYFKQSDTCGSCHVVIVPKVPDDYRGNPFTDPTLDLAYEQTTYFEWAVSEYAAQGVICQSCHMPGLATGVVGTPATTLDIANIESSYYPPVAFRAADRSIQLANGSGVQARSYARHRLLGINLFVHEMFEQFSDLLGLSAPGGDEPAENTTRDLLLAKQSIIDHAVGDPPTASVAFCGIHDDPEALVADVLVTNNSGHKFPTGVGFRRSWLEFQVLDAQGTPLWTSGGFNEWGALVGPDGQVLRSEFTLDPTRIQPHYPGGGNGDIERQDQVQIYETREVDCRRDASGASCACPDPANNCRSVAGGGYRPPRLTTSFLSLFGVVKDNRILPRGWNLSLEPTVAGLEVARLVEITKAEAVAGDPFYDRAKPWLAGSDRVTYRVAKAALSGDAAQVKVTIHYQTLPPYYLLDRFQDGERMAADGRIHPGAAGLGTDTERLLYMTSHLDTDVRSRGAPDGTISGSWTMSLDQASHDLRGDVPPDFCEPWMGSMETRHETLMRGLRRARVPVSGGGAR